MSLLVAKQATSLWLWPWGLHSPVFRSSYDNVVHIYIYHDIYIYNFLYNDIYIYIYILFTHIAFYRK